MYCAVKHSDNRMLYQAHLNIASYPLQLHLKERRRFDYADVDRTSDLNVTEFLAFTHPSEVDRMAVRRV